MTRYDQLTQLIAIHKPRSIVEVGTHNGARAELMCRTALRYREDVHYRGYDLFEEAPVEELNGKGIAEYARVVQRLGSVSQDYPLFSWQLICGNTRETLHGSSVAADFAFIDGGHSVETIRGDLAALRQSQVIALDDYYTSGMDTTKYGCNEVLRGLSYTLLPKEDEISHGARVQIAIIINEKRS